ncbi:MAG TPA: prepilin peptidase, partial [Acidisarcina sp.]
AFGSFLNVCISRLPAGESVVRPPSRCPQCRHEISAIDNIPLLSWLLLRGRCRACNSRISLRYPAVEVVTAALFLLCFFTFGFSLIGAGAAVLCFLLVGLAMMDAETMLLPDAFTVPGIVLGIIYAGMTGWTREPITAPFHLVDSPRTSAVLMSALTGVAAAAFILLIRWIYWLVRRQEGMGLGDVKLMALIGAWFGPAETFLVFFLAVVCGAIYGLVLIALSRVRRSENRIAAPTKVPFGSFLCVAGLFTLFFGAQPLGWYFSLFV